MLRVFHHYLSGRRLAFFLGESLAIACGCLGGALMLPTLLGRHPTAPWVRGALLEAAAMVVALQFILYVLDLYDLRVAGEAVARQPRLVRAAGVVALAAAAAALHWHVPAGTLLGGALGASVGAVGLRSLVATWGSPARRVLVLGDGQKARALRNALKEQGDDAYELVAADSRLWPGAEGETPVLEAARRTRAEAIVLAQDDSRGAVRVEDLLACRFAGIRVFEASAFCERVLRRLPLIHLRSSYLCLSDEPAMGVVRRAAKRVFDIVAASAALLLSLPVLVVVAIAVRCDSAGPVFYGQDRVGLNGRKYRLWKFRSMRQDAESNGAVWAKVNDDRVTRVGRIIRKARMDELPQLLCVLQGHMSFVGPRPERPVFVEELTRLIPFYRLREAVKPGITGWAQIRYPYGASVEDARNKLELDLYYVKNGSLFLDVAILFHTVRHVLLGRGAR